MFVNLFDILLLLRINLHIILFCEDIHSRFFLKLFRLKPIPEGARYSLLRATTWVNCCVEEAENGVEHPVESIIKKFGIPAEFMWHSIQDVYSSIAKDGK